MGNNSNERYIQIQVNNKTTENKGECSQTQQQQHNTRREIKFNSVQLF